MQTNTKIEILSTIDELNQYLNGNVTKTSIVETLTKLQLTIITNKIQYPLDNNIK